MIDTETNDVIDPRTGEVFAVAPKPPSELPTLPTMFGVTDAALNELEREYAGLKADTPEGYERCVAAIARTRGFRSKVEKRRVELKAESLAWGRAVDSEAKRITKELLEIETPIRREKDAVDFEKARVIREAEEARLQAIEAEQKRIRDEEEARLKAIRDAEELRLKEERTRIEAERAKLDADRKAVEESQRAERERIAAEQAKIAEAQRIERERLEAEAAKVRAEKERIERVEFERVARERAEALAEEQARKREALAESQRREAEAAAKERKEREAREAVEEAARLEAAKPDVQKIKDFGEHLLRLVLPVVTTEHAKSFLAGISESLNEVGQSCQEYSPPKRQNQKAVSCAK